MDDVAGNDLAALCRKLDAASSEDITAAADGTDTLSSQEASSLDLGGLKSEQFKVLLVGEPVWPLPESNASGNALHQQSNHYNHGFGPLLRVIEELSQAFFIRVHEVPACGSSATPTKQVQVFR